MNIAVFGGSGVIGRKLLPQLVARGDSVRAMQHTTPLGLDGVRVVVGSITDPAAVAETVRGAEVVVQLTKSGGGVDQTVETSVRGTVNILDAVRTEPAVAQYLLTSSDAAVGICVRPHPDPIDHRTPPESSGGYYALGKVLEETIVLDYHRNYGVPYTIARLSWTQREDTILRHLIAGYDPAKPLRGAFSSGYTDDQRRRLKEGGRFVVLPCNTDGEPLGRTLVAHEDVAPALLAMIGSPAAVSQTFHVSGPGFSYDVPSRYLGDKLGLPVENVLVPNEYRFDIDCSHTTDRLGWTPRYDVIAMIDLALSWRH